MKKIFIGILIVIVLGVGYWLVSPFWRVKTLNEDLPGLKKAMEKMSEDKKDRFIEQMDMMKEVVMEKSEPMSSGTTIISSTELVAEAHNVKGQVLIVESDGKKILRFENLETINGPDLRIYLSSDLAVDDAVDLGPIRATRGNVNYILPDNTDLEKYKNALIWCRAFGVLFSYGKF